MTYTTEDILLISVPLTAKDRKIAEAFASEQSTTDKQQQVYRNTLAVLVTHRYFTMLGIPSELEASESWSASKRKEYNVAALFISEIQDQVECRPIEPNSDRCYIPPEVWRNRAGYIVVELEDSGKEGIIRGFVPEVAVEQLPLSYLQPLDILFEKISLGSIKSDSNTELVTRLSSWKEKVENLGWSFLQDLPPNLQLKILYGSSRDDPFEKAVIDLYKSDGSLALLPSNQRDHFRDRFSVEEALVTLVRETQNDWTRWQAAELLHTVAPEHPSAAVIRAKDLGLYLATQTVALLVGMVMKSDGRVIVMTRVYPIGDLISLPAGLRLTGMTQEGETFFDVKSRERDDYIQFLFTADPGDEFRLQVSVDAENIVESFVV